MKKVMLQLGKAICYVLLFFGMQVAVSSVAQFFYIFKAGFEASATGTEFNMEEMLGKVAEFVMENVNLLTFISGALTLIALWLFFLLLKRKFTEVTVLRRFEGKKVVPIVVLGMASAFFISCGLSLLPLPESLLESYAQSSSSLTGGSVFSIILCTVIMAPLVEEIVFRGLILSTLKQAMNVKIAIVVTGVMFGLVHGQLLWMIYTCLLGIVLAVVAEATGSTLASVIMHAAFNLVGIFGGYLDFTNGQMLVVTVVAFVVIVVCLMLICRRKQEVSAQQEVSEQQEESK